MARACARTYSKVILYQSPALPPPLLRLARLSVIFPRVGDGVCYLAYVDEGACYLT
jgi:hypothetical protein